MFKVNIKDTRTFPEMAFSFVKTEPNLLIQGNTKICNIDYDQINC